jgi:hypothetical protein
MNRGEQIPLSLTYGSPAIATREGENEDRFSSPEHCPAPLHILVFWKDRKPAQEKSILTVMSFDIVISALIILATSKYRN